MKKNKLTLSVSNRVLTKRKKGELTAGIHKNKEKTPTNRSRLSLLGGDDAGDEVLDGAPNGRAGQSKSAAIKAFSWP